MAKLKVDVEVSVFCEKCGGELVAVARYGELHVETCAKCLAEHQDLALNNGYREGWADGRRGWRYENS